MKEQPLVSVLMTSYNREKYIAEAIESVINSTYQNWELIIVDDVSHDKTLEIAKDYEKKDNRIKIYLNDKNLGQFPNRNKAASLANGKYIKYLDSDDIIYPHGLEVMVEAMEKFQDAGIGMQFNCYNEKHILPKLFSTEEAFKYHFFNLGLLYIGPSGCIYRKDFFNKIGQFNPDYKVAADYEFNLRAASQKSTVLFNRDLIWWRQHEGQEIINSNLNNDYIILNYLIHKNIEFFNLDNILKQKILRNNNILMGRRMLKLLIKLKFKSFFKIIKATNFPLKYLFLCIFPAAKL